MVNIKDERLKLEHKIDSLASLEQGWDSYDADPIPEKSRKLAKEFLKRLFDLNPNISLPLVGPTNQPGVLFVWRKGGKEVSIEVTDKGVKLLVISSSIFKENSVLQVKKMDIVISKTIPYLTEFNL